MNLAYFAGYLDGEGCFSLSRNTPRVSVTNTYPGVLLEFKRRFGGSVAPHTHGRGKARSAWRYFVYGKSATALIKAVLPHLREKNQQARLLLDFVRLPKSSPMRETYRRLITQLKRIDYYAPPNTVNP